MADPIEAAWEAFGAATQRGCDSNTTMQAAITAYHEAGGTVAVPREPTEAMVFTGMEATLLLCDSDVIATYKAMIAAAEKG